MNPMQGQGSINNPFAETINIDGANSLSVDSSDVQHFNGWSSAEPSFRSDAVDQVMENGTKAEQGQPSQACHAHVSYSRLEDSHSDRNRIRFPRELHIGRSGSQVRTVPSIMRGSSSNHMQIPNLNNAGEVGQSSGAASGGPSVNNLEESLGGTSSSGVYNLSCKRKAIEGTSGNTSSTNVGCTTQLENSNWHSGPAHDDANNYHFSGSSQNSSNIFPSYPLAGDFVRQPSSVQQTVVINARSVPSANLEGGTGPAQQQSSASASPFDTWEADTQPNLTHINAMSRSIHSFLWPVPVPALSRTHDSSAAEGYSVPREDVGVRTIRGNNLERPSFGYANESSNEMPAMDIWGTSAGASGDDNFGVPMRMSTSARNLLPPNWTHNPQHSQDFAPWSLFPYVATQTSSSPFPVSPTGNASASTGRAVSPGSNNQSHRQRPRRSGLLLDRQGEDLLRLPRLYRNMTTDFQGRSRLISEIRQVLDAMSRGEHLRIEDYMLFDPLVYHSASEMHDRHRDMRLDVDNMSYEDLLELEERIGDVSTGLSGEVILRIMKQRKFAAMSSQSTADADPCCICQEEYREGEGIGTLGCGHEFHGDCIKQWLMQKNLCPVCKTTGLNP